MEIPGLQDFQRLESKIDQLLELKATSTKEIVNMTQAQALLANCSNNYITGLIAKGRLKTAVKEGGLWLFDKREILNLVPSYQSNL